MSDTPTTRTYTAEEQQLIERMRNADVPEIKAFVREVLDAPLPPDYEIPEHVKQAGDPRLANEAINDRYPQFVGKQGPEYLQAVAADPVSYKEMIRESRGLRAFYKKDIEKMKSGNGAESPHQ